MPTPKDWRGGSWDEVYDKCIKTWVPKGIAPPEAFMCEECPQVAERFLEERRNEENGGTLFRAYCEDCAQAIAEEEL